MKVCADRKHRDGGSLSGNKEGNRFSWVLILGLGMLLAAGLTGCAESGYFNYLPDMEVNKKIAALERMMEQESEEIRFALVNEITDTLLKYGDVYKEILFLTNYIEAHPMDAYNALYLYKVAEAYEELNAIPVCIHYYERILNNYPDIKMNNNDIYYSTIQKLLKYVTDKEKIIEYYKLLLSRFFDKSKANIGSIYYYLARAYEGLGEWDRAIQEYVKFLKNPATRIPEEPDAYNKTTEKVEFYYSDKSWTRNDLNGLVAEIRSALIRRDLVRIRNLKSETVFFTKYWNQEEFDKTRADFFNLSTFILSSDVDVERELDPSSNSQEAYLKTRGWSYLVSTWYFYFRRINFPANPEFDGRWEWAGIYFGEK